MWPELTLLNAMTNTAVITVSVCQVWCPISLNVRQWIHVTVVNSSSSFHKSCDRVALSLGYTQCNSQSERSVKTLKEMLERADDPHKALLSYRITP